MKKITTIASLLLVAASASAQVPDNAVKYDKMVVVEEGTGTWCGYCPRGTASLEYFSHNAEYKDRFIGIAVHYAYKGSADPMATNEVSPYSEALNIGQFGFPGARVNRSPNAIDFSKPDMIPPFFSGDCYTNAKIVSLDYDKQNSAVAVNAEFRVGYDCEKAYNMAVVCAENKVSGTSSSYSQHNYFYDKDEDYVISNFGEDWLPYFKNFIKPATSLISYKKMTYNHVARSISDFNGEEIAKEWKADEAVAKTVTIDIPMDVLNVDNLEYVVLMLDPENGQIVGAHKAALFPEDEPTPPDTLVEEVDASQVVSSTYFDMQGRRVENPGTGIYLRRDTRENGQTTTVKVAF